MHNPKYSHIRAAYSFYNVATSVSLSQLMNDALILAKKVRILDLWTFINIIFRKISTFSTL